MTELRRFLVVDLKLVSTSKVNTICARLAGVPLQCIKQICRERWQQGARNGALANFLATCDLAVFAAESEHELQVSRPSVRPIHEADITPQDRMCWLAAFRDCETDGERWMLLERFQQECVHA